MKTTQTTAAPVRENQTAALHPYEGGTLPHEGGSWIRQPDGSLVRDASEIPPTIDDDRAVQTGFEAPLKKD